MPDAPWRCTQCGTVNAPSANACRTCGRWPSLFDLDSTQVDQSAAPSAPVEDVYEPEAVAGQEPESAAEPEPGAAVSDTHLPREFEADDDENTARTRPGWQRFARLIVPIGVVLYILITALANRGGG